MAKTNALALTCKSCKAKCCKYVATEIDKPKNKEEFEEIIWYLLHENIEVFIESGDWYIQFNTSCKALDKDNKCSYYEKRPQICRDLKVGECEHHGDIDENDITFKTPKDFVDYMKEKGFELDL